MPPNVNDENNTLEASNNDAGQSDGVVQAQAEVSDVSDFNLY